MVTLVKWALRALLAYQAVKVASNAIGRSPGENAKAAIDAANNVKGTIMSIKSSATSLNPAREQARSAERAQVPVVRTATTALLGAAGTDAIRIGQWLVQQDEDGNLTAATDDSEPQVIARPPKTNGFEGDLSSDKSKSGKDAKDSKDNR